MPKDRRANPLAFNQARVCPYACHAKDSNSNKLETASPPSVAEREWEETRCPICMEHPHNAILLICSSRGNGCRPYMCDTSYRHSNCLDQYCKSSPAASTVLPGDESLRRIHNHQERGRQRFSQPDRSPRGQGLELMCPLCRGRILGWVVVEAARKYMNSKIRSCSLESCEFSGTYVELRKHARREHPSLRPTAADPQRQSDWVRLQRERDMEDTLSAYQSQFVPDLYGDDLLWSGLYQDDVPMDMETAEGNLFDNFFTGIDSEAEGDQFEEGTVDFSYELEFSFSFLSDLPFYPLDESINVGSARTRSSLLNGRSTRPRSRSMYYREAMSPGVSTTTPSRHRRSRSEGWMEDDDSARNC